jgi:hypothetical protein
MHLGKIPGNASGLLVCADKFFITSSTKSF